MKFTKAQREALTVLRLGGQYPQWLPRPTGMVLCALRLTEGQGGKDGRLIYSLTDRGREVARALAGAEGEWGC